MAYRFHNSQKIIILSLLLAGFFSVAFFARADTATFYAAAGDGYVGRSYGGCDQTTWSFIRNSSFGDSTNYTNSVSSVRASQCRNGLDVAIRRAFFPFDTSALPDGAVVTAATLNMYVSGAPLDEFNDGNDFLSVVRSNQVAIAALSNNDYGITNFTEGSNRVDITSLSSGTWVSFVLNAAGRSWVSPTGNTLLAVLEGHDLLNVYGGVMGVNQAAIRTSNYAGFAPYLTVTYSESAIDNASFVSQTAPPITMTAGATANVSVTMQNTGTNTWTSGGNYRLGSQNPQDNTTWGMNRVNLSAGDSILPGQQKIFNFTVTAPSAPGTYNFQWRMVQDGVAWFGANSTNVSVTVNPAPDITPPVPPTTVNFGSATQNSLTASWSGAGDNIAVTGYRLDVSTQSNFASFVSGYNNLDVGNVTSRVVSGLNPSTTYYARVRAYDAAGNVSVNSATANGTTSAPPPPPNVSGHAWAGSGSNDGTNSNPGIGWIKMSGTAGDGSPYGVLVSSASPGVLSGYAWANPNDGAQNHIGWIDFGPAGSYPVSSFVPAQSARLNRTTGVVTGWARACSVFASGCSGALRAVSELGGWDGWIGFGTGGNYTQPVTVSGCNWSGYAWGGGTNIGWIHFGGALYPTTGSGDACAFVTPQCSDGIDNDGDGLTDFGPGPLNDPGCIDGNDIDEVGPAAPSGLSANAGSGASCNAMVITWTDNSTDESRFELERKLSLDPDTAYVEIAEPSVNATSFTDTGAVGGLLRDTSYAYRIRACNAFGCGAYSNTNSAINQNPLPSFTWTPPSPLQNANTIFNASASTIYGGSSASEYFWTLTDGIPATFCSSSAGGGCDNPPLTPLASTRFQLPPSPEQKSVILRVTDSASRSCSLTQTVSLRINSTLPHWREEAPE